MLRDVLTVILAGGRGTRLEPLTRERAKPAVPFGGAYRIIDFTLSNCVNSGLRRVQVLTQFKSQSLDRHIRRGWNFLSPELGEAVEVLPPQQRIDENWYKGTADAIYQNIYTLERQTGERMLILAGDHIYKMDYAEMLDAHLESGAELTVGAIPVPLAECNQFGILDVDADHRIIGFKEKPETTDPMPGDPHHALGSMGIYVFERDVLFEQLMVDAGQPDSGHDFGKDIIPAMVRAGHKVQAFRFRDRNGKPNPYWRDVGTLDAYYQASMDLVAAEPVLNLYDATWPIRTLQPQAPPPKFVHSADGPIGQARRGEAVDSVVAAGCIVSGGQVRRSILSTGVRVNSYAVVDDSILFDGVDVGRYCRVRHAIIDKGVKLPPYTVIGHDPEFDRRRGFTITANGVVVVAKGEPPETFLAPNSLPF
jgi:glucose-1-phosphate adenylyltransferase